VRSRRTVIYTFLAVLALIILFASTLTYYYVDLLWFGQLGYASVFWTVVRWRLLVGLLGGLIFGLLFYLNLLPTRRGVLHLQFPSEVIDIPYQGLISRRTVNILILLASLVVAVLAGISFSSQWDTVLRYINQGGFGLADPLYGRDVGFYVFSLPLLAVLYQTLSFLLLLLLVVAGLIYFLTGYINLAGVRVNVHSRARWHLGIILAAYFVLKAGGYYLNTFDLLYSPRGVAFGASYADIFAQLPALRIMSVLSLLAAAVVVWYIRSRNLRWIYLAVALLPVASILLGTVYPTLIQQFVVTPNEIQKETPYITHNIKYTRAAYGLETIAEREFPATEDLTWSGLQANRSTIENVRLWDWRPLERTYRQLQTIRPYYDFPDVDVDRYTIDGGYRQVLLSGREIDYEQLPGTSWINVHLKYTHGYGVVMSPASQVSKEGLPTFYIKDIPPRSSINLPVGNPAIYYGLKTEPYVFGNTREAEFDYSVGDENAYAQYAGNGGIPVRNFLRKAAFAVRFGAYQILLTSAITPESRLLMYRQVPERVKKIAPFLMLDRDPYLVVHDDRLFWIQDCYTYSQRFPYSQPYQGRYNYLRNSVKAVVDAYNGDVTFYLAGPDEPVAKTYSRIFPGLFRPLEDMPEGLRAHIRYPQDLFELQRDMYTVYHMEDPVVFYNKEDLWAVPQQATGTQTEAAMEPYYVMIQLPEEEQAEYMLITPYTPARRKNMIAWLAARNDGENYGKLVVFKMPKQRLVYGPGQIDGRIDQDAEISQKMTLWGQSGSRVIRGNLLVIPVEDSIIYVEPIYLESTETQLPELRRVIVAYANRLVMGADLESALAGVFGARPEEPEEPGIPTEPTTRDELIFRASDLYDQAQEALRAGEWARYGQLVEELGRVLQDLRDLSEPPAGSVPPPAEDAGEGDGSA